MKLVVGLGNPGPKYARNRHNVGFMVVDRLAEELRFPEWKEKFSGFFTKGSIDGEDVVLLKPQTYMNESGKSVQQNSATPKAAAGFLRTGQTMVPPRRRLPSQVLFG